MSWFRRDDDGGFLWPGFGENSRILKYVIDRLDVTNEQLEAALRVDVEEWKAELPQINEWFEQFGDKLPTTLWTELDGLKARLEA